MEDAAIKHIIALCEDTQVPCHIVHLATGNAIRKHKYNFATYSKTINIPTAVFPIYPKFSSTPHKIWLYQSHKKRSSDRNMRFFISGHIHSIQKI